MMTLSVGSTWDRWYLTTNQESGIKNDPSNWACEQNDLQYISDFLLPIIMVSLKITDIIDKLLKGGVK
ncbi:MAG: hypothetical protein FWC36_05130 [Spirochaetes bacterium]|nr:hypothetical protein [Spirochaetota bacterium]